MTLFALIPITAVFVVGMIVGRNELVKRRLACPHKGQRADVKLLRRYMNPAKLVGIKRCDLLEDPTRIDCDQECLHVNASRS